jgi:hypothetical protein
LQAGGRRFDPVILHQPKKCFNTKAALQKAALLLIEIERSNGCSLKIHRVESALPAESRKLHRAAGDKNLIASKRTNFVCSSNDE